MGIGGCILLIAVGAILTFGMNLDIPGVHTQLIGVILMAVGAIGLAAYVSIFKRRHIQPPAPAARVVEEDHRITY
ncbi:DUF6458 family protein [Streptomyces capparidis]|jgi:drug/metabolite transporter (DMT)-like permease